jgi:hypothetical protein
VSRTTASLSALIASTALATLAVVVPSTGAGAAGSCTAWGTLPRRVTLGPNGATVRTTLHGTAACAGITTDNGGTAALRGPGSNDDVPLRWTHFGATDEATYYPSLNRPGTYRVVDGRTQTYDAKYVHIASTWRPTATVVKYRGRFTDVSRSASGVTASLEYYGRLGWHRHGDILVSLQRRSPSGTWHQVTRAHTSSSGRVHLSARISASADYRLVSASSTNVWGAVRRLATNRT